MSRLKFCTIYGAKKEKNIKFKERGLESRPRNKKRSGPWIWAKNVKGDYSRSCIRFGIKMFEFRKTRKEMKVILISVFVYIFFFM